MESPADSDHFGALRLLFIGLMIAGPRLSEARVLALAYAYERATEWHTRKPPLTPDTPVPALALADEDAVLGSLIQAVSVKRSTVFLTARPATAVSGWSPTVTNSTGRPPRQRAQERVAIPSKSL